MQVDVLNIEGKKTGRTLELPDEIFGAEPNEHVVYLAVKQFLGAQRQGGRFAQGDRHPGFGIIASRL